MLILQTKTVYLSHCILVQLMVMFAHGESIHFYLNLEAESF